MASSKNLFLGLGITGIVIFGFLLLSPSVSGDLGGFIGGEDKFNVDCRVELGNIVFFDPEIKSSSCDVVKASVLSCSGLTTQSFFSPLTDEASLRMRLAGKSFEKNVAIRELSTETVLISVPCVSKGSYTVVFDLISEDDAVFDTATKSLVVG